LYKGVSKVGNFSNNKTGVEMSFSVLMSLYFKENPVYLDLALKSVFEQTVHPEQVVLVLDGPIGKELQKVVDEFAKKYHSLDVYPQEKIRV
jgi:hypothetical protein